MCCRSRDIRSLVMWKGIPLIWRFGGHRHGAQNVGDGASKATLDNEFGTSNEDECMTKILEKGTIQSVEVR